MKLTGKQKSFLRSRGQTIPTSGNVGKAGASAEVIESLGRLLEAHELIKVRITAADRSQRQDLADQIATATGSACAGTVGHTALLYRPNPSLPPSRRIHLPAGEPGQELEDQFQDEQF